MRRHQDHRAPRRMGLVERGQAGAAQRQARGAGAEFVGRVQFDEAAPEIVAHSMAERAPVARGQVGPDVVEVGVDAVVERERTQHPRAQPAHRRHPPFIGQEAECPDQRARRAVGQPVGKGKMLGAVHWAAFWVTGRDDGVGLGLGCSAGPGGAARHGRGKAWAGTCRAGRGQRLRGGPVSGGCATRPIGRDARGPVRRVPR